MDLRRGHALEKVVRPVMTKFATILFFYTSFVPNQMNMKNMFVSSWAQSKYNENTYRIKVTALVFNVPIWKDAREVVAVSKTLAIEPRMVDGEKNSMNYITHMKPCIEAQRGKSRKH